ncbi:MAG: hypothetical protein K2N22_04355 [Clostridia bacterium]|nr:hypothetical protein [Clostridia bacterium]
MEPQYIVAIIAGSIFLVLILVYIILKIIRDKRALKERARISEVYSDENLAKMDYDFAVYDEELSELLGEGAKREGHTTIDEELDTPLEEVFAKVDSEGMEEITGNYQPK